MGAPGVCTTWADLGGGVLSPLSHLQMQLWGAYLLFAPVQSIPNWFWVFVKLMIDYQVTLLTLSHPVNFSFLSSV